MDPESFHVPRKNPKFKISEIGPSKKWQNLWRESAALQSLFIRARDSDDSEPWAGISLQRPCTDEHQTKPGTLHFGLWIHPQRAEISDEQMAAIKLRLIGRIDALFVELGGLHGWLAQCDWAPRFSTADENEYTPYEAAYSLDSPGTEKSLSTTSYMHAAWCRRCLRGIGETVWLGASLGRRISNQARSSIVEVQAVGSGLRLGVPTIRELPELEAALKPLLPPAQAHPDGRSSR